jgi:uncharacterized protein
LLLIGLITHGALAGNESQREFSLSLGIVPLIRIISISLPIMLQISQFIWYIIISIPILSGIFFVARFLKYSPEDVGLNGHDLDVQILVGISGIGLAAIDYFILQPQPFISTSSIQTLIFPVFILLIFTGFMEELAFRGVMQRASRAFDPFGWILVAAIYAATQIGYGSILHCAFSFGTALFFGWIVKCTRSIIGVSLCHGVINIGLYIALQFFL